MRGIPPREGYQEEDRQCDRYKFAALSSVQLAPHQLSLLEIGGVSNV
jgi:hypothetical protein